MSGKVYTAFGVGSSILHPRQNKKLPEGRDAYNTMTFRLFDYQGGSPTVTIYHVDDGIDFSLPLVELWPKLVPHPTVVKRAVWVLDRSHTCVIPLVLDNKVPEWLPVPGPFAGLGFCTPLYEHTNHTKYKTRLVDLADGTEDPKTTPVRMHYILPPSIALADPCGTCVVHDGLTWQQVMNMTVEELAEQLPPQVRGRVTVDNTAWALKGGEEDAFKTSKAKMLTDVLFPESKGAQTQLAPCSEQDGSLFNICIVLQHAHEPVVPFVMFRPAPNYVKPQDRGKGKPWFRDGLESHFSMSMFDAPDRDKYSLDTLQSYAATCPSQHIRSTASDASCGFFDIHFTRILQDSPLLHDADDESTNVQVNVLPSHMFLDDAGDVFPADWHGEDVQLYVRFASGQRFHAKQLIHIEEDTTAHDLVTFICNNKLELDDTKGVFLDLDQRAIHVCVSGDADCVDSDDEGQGPGPVDDDDHQWQPDDEDRDEAGIDDDGVVHEVDTWDGDMGDSGEAWFAGLDSYKSQKKFHELSQMAKHTWDRLQLGKANSKWSTKVSTLRKDAKRNPGDASLQNELKVTNDILHRLHHWKRLFEPENTHKPKLRGTPKSRSSGDLAKVWMSVSKVDFVRGRLQRKLKNTGVEDIEVGFIKPPAAMEGSAAVVGTPTGQSAAPMATPKRSRTLPASSRPQTRSTTKPRQSQRLQKRRQSNGGGRIRPMGRVASHFALGSEESEESEESDESPESEESDGSGASD